MSDIVCSSFDTVSIMLVIPIASLKVHPCLMARMYLGRYGILNNVNTQLVNVDNGCSKGVKQEQNTAFILTQVA